MLLHLFFAHAAPDHMQTIGDQRVFGFQKRQPQLVRVAFVQIDGLGLGVDQRGQFIALRRIRRQCTPTGQAVFQLLQTFVEASGGERRRQVRDGDST